MSIESQEAGFSPEIREGNILHVSVESQPGLALATRVLKESKDELPSGLDQEALYHAALSFEHPEYSHAIREFLANDKQISDPAARESDVHALLERARQDLTPEEEKKIAGVAEGAEAWWQENLEDVRERTHAINSYFRVQPRQTLLISPSDKDFDSKRGSGFDLGETWVVRVPQDMRVLEHEYMHSFMNNIADRTTEQLTAEQKQKIIEQASPRLIIGEGYGEDPALLLTEELIRTYTDAKMRDRHLTPERFEMSVAALDQEEFERLANTTSTGEQLAELGIGSLKDFKKRAKEFYERFEQNKLEETLLTIYHKYDQARTRDASLSFEHFLGQTLPEHL